MNSSPSLKPNPPDLATLNRLNATAVAYWSVMLIWAGVLLLLWVKRGPDRPAVAFFVTLLTFGLTPGVAVPVVRRLPAAWSRVPAGEHVLHRMLGVRTFGWLLERSGWNRNNAFIGWRFLTRRLLPYRVEVARGSISAHGTCFVIHLLLAVVALVTGHRWGGLWILLPGVVIHLYPVLLQRSILLRIQPLLEKARS